MSGLCLKVAQRNGRKRRRTFLLKQTSQARLGGMAAHPVKIVGNHLNASD